ncbi:MAG TPA: MdtA/MuxA family multidrug efflux RND transporter periplasmic adaptor subunit [Terriglobia bacterium]|jgi:multidrug efflux system membrane fusion protein
MTANQRRWLRRFTILVVFVLVVVVFSHYQKNAKSAPPPAPPSTPVVTAMSKTGDQPIYLTGLGTVTPFETVTLTTRVDGQLMDMPVREGQMVSAGDLVAQIDPRPFQVQLLQAQGQLDHDQALLANARVDLERYKALASEDAVPKQMYDTQVALVHQDEATLKSDEGAVENAKLQLVYARITSPVTGRMGLRFVDPGNIVHASDTTGIAVITKLQPIAVIFNIAEDSIPTVNQKLQAGRTLAVDAFDRDFKKKIASGSLLTIDNQVDVNTGTVRFKATFPNKDNALFPSQFVNARLLVDVNRGVVLIPSGAVQRGPQSTFVFVVKADSTVETRNVVVGPINADIAEIDKGLSANETVVTEGVDKLQSGMKVTERQPISP